jgi:hypothetical protein
MDIENWYFTFGYGQHDGTMRHCYVKIAGTLKSSREEMIHRYGMQWSMQYNEGEFLPQIEKYGLSEVKPSEAMTGKE